jgi:hypothetical protein
MRSDEGRSADDRAVVRTTPCWRARQFRSVAIPLEDINNGEPNWPKYFLLFHAIELALKAVPKSILTPPFAFPRSHRNNGHVGVLTDGSGCEKASRRRNRWR